MTTEAPQAAAAMSAIERAYELIEISRRDPDDRDKCAAAMAAAASVGMVVRTLCEFCPKPGSVPLPLPGIDCLDTRGGWTCDRCAASA